MASAVKLLQLSPTMTEGTVVKWLVKEGDEVESGTPIVEVETDKAVMEQESFEDGKILKIVVPEGEKVAVETLLAVIGEDGEDISELLGGAGSGGDSAPKKQEKKEEKKESPSSSKDKEAPKEEKSTEQRSGERIYVSPLAKKMAREHDLTLTKIKGSGPNGRIIRRDIESAIKRKEAGMEASDTKPISIAEGSAAGAAPAPSGGDTIRVSGMRATIAKRLVESKQLVPHFQISMDVRGEKLLEAVKRVREMGTETKVTVSHFLIKAMGSTLMRHKALRTQWGGDNLHVMEGAHISIAIAIEDGLLTPVMRNVQSKGVVQIATELKEFAAKAKDRKLTGDDLTGGVQTLSNLGMYDVDQFNAIINPPEASILAVGAMQDRPVVEDGQVVAGKVMTLTLSADHRVVDGAVAAEYLRDLRRALEDPMLMLL
ncbi:MAG: 2-oxo acid dehydrogenase subunit E2 [Candidatus Sumerlaeia bacterium]|nr:2-oxo acid dehydrogenase subunit E2 [Candidatus Sumerlaeia bacterium]